MGARRWGRWGCILGLDLRILGQSLDNGKDQGGRGIGTTLHDNTTEEL